MESRRTRYGYALRLDRGEEIIASLRAFATAENARAGLLSGIGAVGEAELGFFDLATRAYTTRRLDGQYEILSLAGNLSDLEGEPFPHCHVVLSGSDFAALGGHLFRGVVSVTCEIQVVTDPRAVRRVRRPDLGFNPIELSD